MTRLQLFMNDFALHHPFDLTQHLFSHQGLYNVTKLIRQRPFPPRQGMPASIQQHWNVFTGSLNGDIYIVQGFSAQLTVTCKAQAACNKTHIVKNFERRIKGFVKFRLMSGLTEVKKKNCVS